jgi:4-amino-4-deoxy-L-arabinose transferase-like glycosyltransferase
MLVHPLSHRHLLMRSGVAAALVVGLCSFSVRLGFAARENADDVVRYYSDARSYLEPARHLLNEGAFLNQHGLPEVQRTPGYPAFVATLMAMTGRDLRFVLLAQTLILSLTPVIVYGLARGVMSPGAAVIAGLLAALSPWNAVLASAPMSDGLFLLVLSIVFLLTKLTAAADGGRAMVGAVLLGLLTGVAVLVRPVTPLILLVPPALWFTMSGRRERAQWLVAIALICAVIPPALWRERNIRVRQFASVSEVSGLAAWQYLAARVRSEATGQDRFLLSTIAEREELSWGVEPRTEEMNAERWRHATQVFRAHPFLTMYAFIRSALEHALHPSPDVLAAPRLRFASDYLVLGVVWFGLLSFAVLGCTLFVRHARRDQTARGCRLVVAIAAICALLTLSSGISFGEGSRLRAPLDIAVPLLAAAGCVDLWERRKSRGVDKGLRTRTHTVG